MRVFIKPNPTLQSFIFPQSVIKNDDRTNV